MAFNLGFPANHPHFGTLQLESGEVIFVLGANGSGKSALMQRFASQNRRKSRKIAAHRQTWMNSDSLDMTPSTKIATEKNIENEDGNQRSRYRDRFAAERASMIIFELIDAENIRARTMASAYDSGNMDKLSEAAKVEAPIAIINELLLQSNIPISISIQANERVIARKVDGPEYSAMQLSDGERNALLIAANVLTAPEGEPVDY